MYHRKHTLSQDGGILRFYRGVGPALIQGPMSRFGDTAANAGTLALLDSYDATNTLPVRRILVLDTLHGTANGAMQHSFLIAHMGHVCMRQWCSRSLNGDCGRLV
jgi:hypothetical protein